ncbi:MAG: hypothetical protein U0K95_04375, partial [Eubacterium sp.]|nr:hypothetical protein [Eubacterium sp.]
SSELNYLSSRVFINGRKELWGRTSGFDLDANGTRSMIVQSDLSINENNRSNHAMSVITDPDSYDINSYGLLNLTYDILRFSIYICNLKADKYNGQRIQIFVTGY